MATTPFARPPKDLDSFLGRKWLESLVNRLTGVWAGVTIGTAAPLAGGGNLSIDRTITTEMNTGKLIGRTSPGSGVMEEISLGGGLSLSGGVLSLGSGGGSGGSSGSSGDREQLLFMGF